tara:strand:- start:6711 stop:7607 length:897 start_codon:yes stop_codon:yes gene_type:complete
MEIYGPWYTFDETKAELSLKDSELRFLLDKGTIRAIIYSTERLWLIRELKDQDWIGYGQCRYRGAVHFHRNVISNLLDGHDVSIGATGAGRLLEPENAGPISRAYPYTQQTPNSFITKWNDQPISHKQLLNYWMTPAPTEEPSVKHLLENLKEVMSRIQDASLENAPPQSIPKTSLSFKLGKPLKPSDIRIPKSEIERYKQERNAEKSTLTAPNFTRENALRNVLIKLIEAHPDAKSKKLWELLKQDYESDNPEFDQSYIIQNMDDFSLEWRLPNSDDRELKRDSFGATISRIRKNIK